METKQLSSVYGNASNFGFGDRKFSIKIPLNNVVKLDCITIVLLCLFTDERDKRIHTTLPASASLNLINSKADSPSSSKDS